MTSLKLRPALTAALAGLTATLLLGLGLASQARAATDGPHAAVLSTPAPAHLDPFLEGWGPDAATARIAATDAQGRDLVVLIHGGDQLCVFATDPVVRGSAGGGCAPFSSFNEQGIIGVLWGGESEPVRPDVVYGAVPDGVGSVQAHDPDGTTRTIPVTHNVLSFLRGAATTVTFDGPSGLVTVPVAMSARRAAQSKAQRATARHRRHTAGGHHRTPAHRKGHGHRAAR